MSALQSAILITFHSGLALGFWLSAGGWQVLAAAGLMAALATAIIRINKLYEEPRP